MRRRKIHFDRVTWYSIVLSVLTIALLVVVAFSFGLSYRMACLKIMESSLQNPALEQLAYMNTLRLKKQQYRDELGFSFSYPATHEIEVLEEKNKNGPEKQISLIPKKAVAGESVDIIVSSLAGSTLKNYLTRKYNNTKTNISSLNLNADESLNVFHEDGGYSSFFRVDGKVVEVRADSSDFLMKFLSSFSTPS